MIGTSLKTEWNSRHDSTKLGIYSGNARNASLPENLFRERAQRVPTREFIQGTRATRPYQRKCETRAPGCIPRVPDAQSALPAKPLDGIIRPWVPRPNPATIP